MAVSAKWYGPGMTACLSKLVDWTSDTIAVQLHTSTYTPDQDAHAVQSDLTNEVASANGYTTGGVTLTSKTRTYQAGSNRLELDAADVSWTATSGNSITARYAVVIDKTPGSAGTNRLLGYVDFGADVTATGAALTITWDATGLLTLTAA
jgi:hypothetical protein